MRLPLLLFAALSAAGVADLFLRYNRSHSHSIAAAVERLQRIPDRIGHWEGAEQPLDEIVVRVAGCSGYRNLRYVHSLSGRFVDFTLMVGLAGQMAEHLPEVCFPAGGYSLIQQSFARRSVAALSDGITGELAVMDFLNPRLTNGKVRVWHGWYDGAGWTRPESPRFRFAARASLVRLQVWSALTPDPLSDDGKKLVDAGEEFLRDALPTLTRIFADYDKSSLEL